MDEYFSKLLADRFYFKSFQPGSIKAASSFTCRRRNNFWWRRNLPCWLFCIYFSSKIPAIFFLKTLRRDFWLCLHLELFDVNYFVPIKSCLDDSKFWLLFETSLNHSTPLPIDKITQYLNRNKVNGIFY